MTRYCFLFIGILITFVVNAQVSDSLLKASNSNDPEVARPAVARKYSIWLQMGKIDATIEEVQSNLKNHQHINNLCFKALFNNILGTSNYYKGQYNKCLPYFEKAIDLWDQCGDKKEKARSISNLASIYGSLGNLDTAEILLLENFDIRKELADTSGLISTGNNLAEIYRLQGDIEKALNQSFDVLGFTKENSLDEASIYDIIGNLYESMERVDEAFKYWKKAYAIRKEQKDTFGMSSSELNYGIFYSYKEKYDSAVYYLELAIDKANTLNNNSIKAYAKNNLAGIKKDKKNYSGAKTLYLEAAKIFKENGDYGGLGNIYGNLCDIETIQENYLSAKKYCDQSLEIWNQIASVNKIRTAHLRLSIVHEKIGDLEKALYHHKEYVIYKDSVLNEENLKQINDLKTAYETEKQILENEKLKVKQLKTEAEGELKDKRIEAQAARLSLFITIIIVILILGIIIFIALRRQKRLTSEIRVQKTIVEEQKHIVEEQKNEIVESIQYAKRLQNAILPNHSMWNQQFSDNFVFFEPKDIVSGDFYWFNRKADDLFFAVADCTGHGVPGAMVSFVCYNALNTAIKSGIINPGQILDYTRSLVLETFSKSSLDINDGMDIALCHVNKKTHELSFSGAYNSLWVVSKNKSLADQNPNGQSSSELDPEYSLYEWKGDKMPVGRGAKDEKFSRVKITLSKDDTIYLSSDGFADQFGGDKGKKLKSKNMKELLVTIQKIPLEDQGKTLANYFEKWKKDFEQLDDVCVIGVRL